MQFGDAEIAFEQTQFVQVNQTHDIDDGERFFVVGDNGEAVHLYRAIAQESRAQATEAAYARRAESAERSRAPLDDFRRAMGACMQSRGYRVG